MLSAIILFIAILCTIALLYCLGLLIIDIILYQYKPVSSLYSSNQQSNLYIFCLILAIVLALLYSLVYYLSFI